MQFQLDTVRLASHCTFAKRPRCPHCGDWMVAPTLSEFDARGEIHHHWLCESCGAASRTSIRFTTH